jgi:hypothetical protein
MKEHADDTCEDHVLGRVARDSCVPSADDALVVDMDEDVTVVESMLYDQEMDSEFDTNELKPPYVFWIAIISKSHLAREY